MSDELKVLAVPLDAQFSDSAYAVLEAKGIVIIRSSTPEVVRLVTPTSGVDVLPANEFMWAALDALAMNSERGYSEPDAPKLRARFTKNLADIATKKRRKLIGWSADIAAPPAQERTEG